MHDPNMMPPDPGAPPMMDPSMMGGPGGPPMDPSMDPSQMGGPPPGDPSMMGPPPEDPNAGVLPPPVPSGPPSITRWIPASACKGGGKVKVKDSDCAEIGGQVIVGKDGRESCWLTSPGEAAPLPPGYRLKTPGA